MGMGINPFNFWPIHWQVKFKQRKYIKTLHANLTYNSEEIDKRFRNFYKYLQNDPQQDTIEDVLNNINLPKSDKKTTTMDTDITMKEP